MVLINFRKEFCNSYFLQIHRANKHGVFDEATASTAFMMSMAGATDAKEPAESQLSKSSTSPASSNASNNIRPVVLKSDKDKYQVGTVQATHKPVKHGSTGGRGGGSAWTDRWQDGNSI